MCMEIYPFAKYTNQINEGFRTEFVEIAENDGFGAYSETLYRELSKSEPDYHLLLTYGFEHLPSELNRPEKKLATFFLTLSEINQIPDNIRDLAIDAMVYCENDDDAFYPGGIKELIQRKEKILPTNLGRE
jgi:hypothetical protein